MRNTVAATILRVVPIVPLPFALAGYVLFTVKVSMFSRKSGVSATALAPLYTRWM
jgi:hypothetical protein